MPFIVLHDIQYIYIYIVCRLQYKRQCHTPTDNFPFLFTNDTFRKGRGTCRL